MGFGQLPVRRVRRLSTALIWLCALAILLVPASARAQPDTQLWAEFTLQWIKSHRITYSVDFEPKVLLWAPAGDPDWAAIDVTPKFDYTLNSWATVGSEFLVGWTKQDNDVNTLEITPRVDLQLHLLGNILDEVEKEKRPKRRVVVGALVRLEFRNLYYSDDTPKAFTLRLRNRVEMQVALTRPRITDNGVTYALTDMEWFWTVDDPKERYASKERFRAGIGYRHSFRWRYEALYILNRSRKSKDASFTASDNIIDITAKRVW
jgi:hypothetical protein